MLPRGVLRGLKDALSHCDVTGLMRAGAIIAGFIMTATGYLVGNAALFIRCFSVSIFIAAQKRESV